MLSPFCVHASAVENGDPCLLLVFARTRDEAVWTALPRISTQVEKISVHDLRARIMPDDPNLHGYADPGLLENTEPHVAPRQPGSCDRCLRWKIREDQAAAEDIVCQCGTDKEPDDGLLRVLGKIFRAPKKRK